LARIIAGTAGVAIALQSPGKAIAEEPCARVVSHPDLPAEWSTAADELRKQLTMLPPAECQPMTLLIEPQGDGVRIAATTPDGRHAARGVSHPESLVAVGLGLVMTIPAEGASPRPLPSSPPPSPAVATPAQPADPALEAHAIHAAPANLALWVGLSSGLRLAAPISLSALDVEARADLFLNRWLLMLTIRSAIVSCLGKQGIDCDVYNDVSVGFGLGHRFHAGGPDVDLGFQPSLVVMHMEYEPTTGGQAVVGSDVVLRLDASSRLAIPIGQGWALTVTLDGGLAPSLLANPAVLPLPPGTSLGTEPPPAFPAWSGGVRIGLSGALL
jgi:hypothetical protein